MTSCDIVSRWSRGPRGHVTNHVTLHHCGRCLCNTATATVVSTGQHREQRRTGTTAGTLTNYTMAANSVCYIMCSGVRRFGVLYVLHCHFQYTVMSDILSSDTLSCLTLCHVRHYVMSDTLSCLTLCNVRHSVMSDTRSCLTLCRV